MQPTVREILAPLDSHGDRIVRTPLTAAEVDALGERVGLPIPAPFREFLLEVGLFQDLTWGVSDIELHDSVDEIVAAREFVAGRLPAKHQDLLPIGGDGAGNEDRLPTAEGKPCRIHFFDHETGKVAGRKDFSDWLQSVVAKVMRGMRRRVPNERKVWAVQFSLPNQSFAGLEALLSTVGTVRVIDPDWTDQETVDEVTSSMRRFELDGAPLRAQQLEYDGWAGPQLFFEMREPLVGGSSSSRIRALDRLFKAKWPGYKLIDYGALDREAL